MNKYWSRRVRELSPYIPGEQPKDKKYIKLNTNENPYPPSPKAVEAMKLASEKGMQLYPLPEFEGLRDALAGFLGLKREQVYAGNGSDELLAFCFMAFFDPGREILFPDITYSFYPVYARLFDIAYEEVPLDESLKMNVDAFCTRNGGVIFPNPNAPTGRCLTLAEIQKILDYNTESVVVIDEAYIDFGGESAVSLINSYPNLLVVRTLSKSHSLAGLRAGYIAGNEELIQAVIRVKNSFNSYTMDRVAQAGAEAAILDTAYFEQTKKAIIKTREWVSEALADAGFSVVDSKANFIFAAHPKVPAEEILIRLKAHGILVRHFKNPRIINYLRISIGTDSEMEKLVEALKEIISNL